MRDNIYKELQKTTIDFCFMFAKSYKYKYGVSDLTGELYIQANRKIKTWKVPNDDIEGIRKAWGKYLSLCFRDVVHRNMKDGVQKKRKVNGENFNPMVDFENGIPDNVSVGYEKSESNAKKIIRDLRSVLTIDELDVLRLRTDLYYGKSMTLDEISEFMGMSKSKISNILESAQDKSIRYLRSR
tara:strand:+ start:1419 stop:1970 length:552 start_codon:yes stop_codon:yes gene_type:complete